ncbi:hypothetical protein ABFV54_27205, partial [Pseudomonas syringae]|uniref:hypothetical protein n=1 Tax=Pseudomonas syringae TaxID=317 RepID=UPI0034D4AB63
RMHQKLFFYQRQFRYSKTAFATLCILLGISASIHAQEDGATPPVLNTIQLRAQGNWLEDVTAKKVFEHPGARTTIDRKQLDETASTTLKDA